MKNLLAFFAALIIGTLFISGQANSGKQDVIGKWKYEASYAPEGYASGIVEFCMAGDKYTTTISFTGSDYKVPGEKTEVEKGRVSFNVNVEGERVEVFLKSESSIKLSGKAVYSQGEIPLTLTKQLQKK
jgi:hypothetical protein